MSSKLNKKGFTLIEVVLVLAIGGLIFLLAFLAFQQVQTNRRDTERRSAAGRVVAELQNYKGDTGSLPAASAAVTPNICAAPSSAGTAFQDFMWGYLCGKVTTGFVSPQGNYTTIASGTPTKDQILFVKDVKCSGNTTTASTGNSAVLIGLEKGVVCRDDS